MLFLHGAARADSFLLDPQNGMQCAPADDRACHGTTSRYGAGGPYFDENGYAGMLYAHGYEGAIAGSGRIVFHDAGLVVRDISYIAGDVHTLPIGAVQPKSTINVWAIDATYRLAIGATNNVWVEAGAAGVHGNDGLVAGARAEHRWVLSFDIEAALELRAYFVDGGRAYELVASAQLALLRLSYHLVKLDTFEHELLQSPEIGIAFRF